MERSARTKTKYMECKFHNRRQSSKELVTIASKEVAQIDKFRYQGLIIHNNWEIEKDGTHRI